MSFIKTLPQSIYWGFAPGLVTSFIGAYKDTLYEEFETLKFFRSTIITFAWYLLINMYFPKDPVILKIGLSSMMERVCVETYKALHKPAPGKFKNCKCEEGKCTVYKDRGWILDRLMGGGENYDGAINSD